MNTSTNKIDAINRNLSEVLSKKYTVDYFQREYRWQPEHIEQLVTDLTSSFLNDYHKHHSRKDGEKYNQYYLGPFVLNDKDSKRSIIDGQQRLTSITLFLIFLNNLQKELNARGQIEDIEDIENMIFSDYRGGKTFNIDVAERRDCLQALLNRGNYEPREDDDESTINMAARYKEIDAVFRVIVKSGVWPHSQAARWCCSIVCCFTPSINFTFSITSARCLNPRSRRQFCSAHNPSL